MKIITDSAADITAQQAENMKIEIVPIRIQFGTRECPMDTEEDFDDFFRQLQQSRELPKTSQPSPRNICAFFRRRSRQMRKYWSSLYPAA